jgi:hypothetical protein
VREASPLAAGAFPGAAAGADDGDEPEEDGSDAASADSTETAGAASESRPSAESGGTPGPASESRAEGGREMDRPAEREQLSFGDAAGRSEPASQAPPAEAAAEPPRSPFSFFSWIRHPKERDGEETPRANEDRDDPEGRKE